MIALSNKSSLVRHPVCHHRFLEMLPAIRRNVSRAFRGHNPELREELITEAVANAFVAFVRLAERGQEDLAYATPLASFAVKQIAAGRRVGGRLACRDVASRRGQLSKAVRLASLDRFDREQGVWLEILVEDRQAGPAETAASRLDFSGWLQRLSPRQRTIAGLLASGESTTTAARQLGITPGRVSQMRRELLECWEAFHGRTALQAG